MAKPIKILKEEIKKHWKSLEKTTSEEIIRVFKGVSLAILMEDVSNIQIEEMKKAIQQLWNNDETVLNYAMSKNSDKHLREYLSKPGCFNNNYSFLTLGASTPL